MDEFKKPVNDARIILMDVARYLIKVADEFDFMAIENRRGGWSTNQEKKQHDQARALRLKAQEIYETVNNPDLFV